MFPVHDMDPNRERDRYVMARSFPNPEPMEHKKALLGEPTWMASQECMDSSAQDPHAGRRIHVRKDDCNESFRTCVNIHSYGFREPPFQNGNDSNTANSCIVPRSSYHIRVLNSNICSKTIPFGSLSSHIGDSICPTDVAYRYRCRYRCLGSCIIAKNIYICLSTISIRDP